MKKAIWISALGLAAFLVYSVRAEAETIRATLLSKSPSGQALTIRPVHPSTGREDKIKIFLKNGTRLLGVSTLDELQDGDEVFIDVTRSAGDWQADSIRLSSSIRNANEPQRGNGRGIQPAAETAPRSPAMTPAETAPQAPAMSSGRLSDESAPTSRRDDLNAQKYPSAAPTTQNDRDNALRAAEAV